MDGYYVSSPSSSTHSSEKQETKQRCHFSQAIPPYFGLLVPLEFRLLHACSSSFLFFSFACKILVGRNISVLGYRGVGKSATVIQYVDGHFVDSYLPTIENTFYKTVAFRNEDIDLSIRDTTGQDELTVFHPRNCLGVHGYVLVFSVTSKYSFEIVKYINDRLLTNLMGTNSVARVLVGNKCDLEQERCVRTWVSAFLRL